MRRGNEVRWLWEKSIPGIMFGRSEPYPRSRGSAIRVKSDEPLFAQELFTNSPASREAPKTYLLAPHMYRKLLRNFIGQLRCSSRALSYIQDTKRSPPFFLPRLSTNAPGWKPLLSIASIYILTRVMLLIPRIDIMGFDVCQF